MCFLVPALRSTAPYPAHGTTASRARTMPTAPGYEQADGRCTRGTEMITQRGALRDLQLRHE